MAFFPAVSARMASATRSHPPTFLQAVLFQWVNPKVWAVALAAMAYVPDLAPTGTAMALGLTFSGVNLGVCLFWTYAGTLLSYLLKNEAAWMVFLRIMAVALVCFSVLVFI